jgi:hypothetical protein
MEITVDTRQLRRILLKIIGERNPYSAASHLAEVENLVEREFGSYSLRVESDYFPYRGKR